MKSLICSLVLILCSFFLRAQTTTLAYPIKQGIANSPTTEGVTNAMYGKFIIYSYADTTAANLDPYIKKQSFAFISTVSPIALWYRDLTNQIWLQLSVSGSPTVSSWLTRGNDLSGQSLPNRLGTKNGDGLNIITNDLIRAIIPVGGIVRSSSAQNKYLMIDTVGKEIYYTEGPNGGAAYTGSAPVEISVANIISMQAASALRDGYTTVANFNLWTNKWGPAGNNATGGDFIGTTNAQPLLFRTNNLQVGSISADDLYKILWGYKGGGAGATGNYAFAFGYEPTISGIYAHGGGFQVTASGVAACALNRNTVASGSYSFACNSSSIASGQASFAANNSVINTFGGAGFGLNVETATDASLPTSIGANNRIFVIGNGSATNARHNALTVLQGSDVSNGTKPLFGFNTLTPASTVEVAGSFAAKYVAKTADYTATELDYTIHFTANTNTFTLPTAVGCTGRIYIAKNTSGNVLTLGTTSSQTIDGAAPTTVANGAAAQFQSTGANWIKIN